MVGVGARGRGMGGIIGDGFHAILYARRRTMRRVMGIER